MLVEITWFRVLKGAAVFFVSMISTILLKIVIHKCRKRKSVRGKIAMVTGGANGLGKEICIILASLGCNIAVVDIDITSALATAEILREQGILARAYKVDVSNYDEISQLKIDVLTDMGEVDILINNAGIIPYKTIFQQSAEELERLTRVNLNSVMLMTKCFLENMIERRCGHVATVTSLSGIYPNSDILSYCATKCGATGFTLGLKELVRKKKLDKQIQVTCILPDVMDTRLDVINAVNRNYKKLRADAVARQAVDGILLNESFVTVPSYYGFLIKIFHIMPFWGQHLIRDHVRKESRFIRSPVKHV